MDEVRNKIDKLEFSFQEIQDCVFFLINSEEYTDKQATEAITFSKGVKQRAEEDCNRFFIYRDFLDLYYQDMAVSDIQLIEIAKIFSATLQKKLAKAFPDKTFTVLTIGDNLVDVEPLELCVTFYENT